MILCFCTLLVGALLFAGSREKADKQKQQAQKLEEEEDYYKNWLDQDVVYIVTPEERSVFESLTTNEEKEQFIEQFWYRRDPDPRTAQLTNSRKSTIGVSRTPMSAFTVACRVG